MTIDHFRPEQRDAFVGFAPSSAERFYAGVDWLAKRFHVEVEGIEKVPDKRALLVANHTFGWDIAFAMAAIWQRTKRPVWALGEHAWWRVPFVRRVAAAVGTVDGTPANADRLLSNDQLVLVMPGGLREAVKPHELRYRLLWGSRYGFVSAAIRNQAPLVPIAAIGSEELFVLVGNAYRRGERWLHRKGLPVPLPSRMPHRTKLRFVIGDPIEPPHDGANADDPILLRRLRHEVEGALHELLETELARRAGIDL